MILPILSIPAAVTMAPRIEVYNLLVCSVHRPEIFDLSFIGTQSNATHGRYNVYSESTINTTTSLAYQTQFVPNISNQRRAQVDPMFLYSSNPESPQSRCASDPVVRTAVAKLTAGESKTCSTPWRFSNIYVRPVIAATTGIMMCITTGWWGSASYST